VSKKYKEGARASILSFIHDHVMISGSYLVSPTFGVLRVLT
jgi:hypothetical protein